MTTAEWLDRHVPDSPDGRSLDEVFARALAPDVSDIREEHLRLEREAKLEDAIEARAMAFRGVDLAARSQRMARRMSLQEERDDLAARIAGIDRRLEQIASDDRWDAEQAQRSAALAWRSAPVGLGDGDPISPAAKAAHDRLVQRSQFMREHGYGATLRAASGE